MLLFLFFFFFRFFVRALHDFSLTLLRCLNIGMDLLFKHRCSVFCSLKLFNEYRYDMATKSFTKKKNNAKWFEIVKNIHFEGIHRISYYTCCWCYTLRKENRLSTYFEKLTPFGCIGPIFFNMCPVKGKLYVHNFRILRKAYYSSHKNLGKDKGIKFLDFGGVVLAD